jgi:hypothetical protein
LPDDYEEYSKKLIEKIPIIIDTKNLIQNSNQLSEITDK